MEERVVSGLTEVQEDIKGAVLKVRLEFPFKRDIREGSKTKDSQIQESTFMWFTFLLPLLPLHNLKPLFVTSTTCVVEIPFIFPDP